MCGGIVSSMGGILNNLAEDFFEGIKWMGKMYLCWRYSDKFWEE